MDLPGIMGEATTRLNDERRGIDAERERASRDGMTHRRRHISVRWKITASCSSVVMLVQCQAPIHSEIVAPRSGVVCVMRVNSVLTASG